MIHISDFMCVRVISSSQESQSAAEFFFFFFFSLKLFDGVCSWDQYLAMACQNWELVINSTHAGNQTPTKQ